MTEQNKIPKDDLYHFYIYVYENESAHIRCKATQN